MNNINVHLGQDLTFLEEFVARALAFGRQRMGEADPANGCEVHVGDTSFLFAESEEFLRPHLGACLQTNAPISSRKPRFSVFADYSSWHVDNGFGPPHEKFQTMAELINALAQFGVRGFYRSHEDRWDLFFPHHAFGIRLQSGVDRIHVGETWSPLPYFCNWIAREDNKIMLHAASVAHEGVGALLVGAGGAGKSGTTLGAMLGGLQSSGDDYTLLTQQKPYFAHAIHRTVKQDVDGLKRLGLPTDFELNWQNKAVFRPEAVLGSAIVDAVEVRAIILPQRGADKATLHELSAAEVYKAMAFSTFNQLGADPAMLFKICGDIARDLPCFRFDVSADNDENVGVLKQFLSTL